MLRAENLIRMGKPSVPYDKKSKRWPKWTTWPFEMMYNGKVCATTFIMGEGEHRVYLAERAVLEQVRSLQVSEGVYRNLLNLIEKYVDTREQKGRDDVNEDFALRGIS